MKIYIAGPITGIFNYRDTFAAAEADLKAKGHITINPSFLPDGLKDYMPTCKAMIDQADAIYMLNNWENSVGATEELQYAREKKKKIFFQNHYSNLQVIIQAKPNVQNIPYFLKKKLQRQGRNM